MSCSISELARFLGLPYHGDGHRQVQKVSGWEEADGSSLIFLDGSEMREKLPVTLTVACIIAPASLVASDWNAIISENPKLDFARAAELLLPRPLGRGIRHITSVLSPEAFVGPDVDLGPYSNVGTGARLGARCILHAGVVVAENCIVGECCILHPGVVLYPGVQL